MKRLCFIFVIIFLFTMAVPVLAQQQVGNVWVSRFHAGDDRAHAMVVDGAGNVYVTGTIAPAPGFPPDYATVKYLPDGTQQWVRTYAGPAGTDVAVAIALDGFGNVGVTGFSNIGGIYNYVTIKYDPAGNQLWLIPFTRGFTDYARDIAADNAGNVYVTGISRFMTGGFLNMDFLTQKYNPGGGVAWTQAFNGGSGGDDSASAIAVDNSGNVFVVGQCKMTQSPAPTSRAIGVVSYDAAGNIRWVGYFGSWPAVYGYSDYPYDVVTDAAGNVYVTGRKGYGVDYITTKFASNGAGQWLKTYNGPGNSNDEAKAIAVDADGNVYVTGYSYGSGTGPDYATIKYRANGDTAWVRRYDGPDHSSDYANAIAIDNAGNVYVTGQSNSSLTGYDYVTVKYDSSGNQRWVQTYNGPVSLSDVAVSMAANNAGNVYVTGYSDGGGTSYDYATMMLWWSNPPLLVVTDSSKFLCGPDTIRTTVTATDPDVGDTITISGPGIPVPVKGVSPLSVEAKIYVNSPGSHDYVFTATDRHLVQDVDTATYVITMNTVPAVTTPDSSKMFCGPDTIRFRVTATDPNTGDTLTLSGPGIPTPITGLSPLSADVKMYVSSPGSYGYVYVVSDLCGAIKTDTAAWVITMNTTPAVTSPDSSKFFCGPDTIRFKVTATDPNPGDSLTLSGPGIPSPIKGLSPLSANVKNYVSSPGTYNYIYNVTDKCGLSNADTATWAITMNAPPNPFSLTAPVDSLRFVPFFAPFDWQTATDPDPGIIKYSLYVSTTPSFNPDSTFAHNNILVSQYTDTLGIGRIYWKVEAFDPCNAFTWSTETWTLLVAMRGDANADKKLSVADVVYIINYLFKGGPLPIPEKIVGDANCDGGVSVADVVYLINYLFKGGPAPC